MVYYAGLFLASGHAAKFVMRIIHVERAVTTAIWFLTCAAYGVDEDFALDLNCIKQSGYSSIFLPPLSLISTRWIYSASFADATWMHPLP